MWSVDLLFLQFRTAEGFLFCFQLQSDGSNSEARQQYDLTTQLSQTVQQAESFYSAQDYAKTIEFLSTVLEVNRIDRLFLPSFSF